MAVSARLLQMIFPVSTNGWTEAVPYLLEDRLKQQSARFAGAGVYQAHALREGHLISGQNPPSSDEAARLVLEVLREQGKWTAKK